MSTSGRAGELLSRAGTRPSRGPRSVFPWDLFDNLKIMDNRSFKFTSCEFLFAPAFACLRMSKSMFFIGPKSDYSLRNTHVSH